MKKPTTTKATSTKAKSTKAKSTKAKTKTKAKPQTKPSRSQPKRNPPPAEKYSFKIPGPMPSTAAREAVYRDLIETLKNYGPAHVTPRKVYLPWLSRRMSELGTSDGAILRALERAANERKVTLQFDRDIAHVLGRDDWRLCPRNPDGDPLIWIVIDY